MRISDWSSDVCSSDLSLRGPGTEDAAAVAGDVDARSRGLAPGVGDRMEAALRGVPAMLGTDQAGELRVRHHPLVQRQEVGLDPFLAAGARTEAHRRHRTVRPALAIGSAW